MVGGGGRLTLTLALSLGGRGDDSAVAAAGGVVGGEGGVGERGRRLEIGGAAPAAPRFFAALGVRLRQTLRAVRAKHRTPPGGEHRSPQSGQDRLPPEAPTAMGRRGRGRPLVLREPLRAPIHRGSPQSGQDERRRAGRVSDRGDSGKRWRPEGLRYMGDQGGVPQPPPPGVSRVRRSPGWTFTSPLEGSSMGCGALMSRRAPSTGA